MVQNSKKQEAIKLRLKGKSYGEILKALNISSKGFLSYWFRDLKLSYKVQKLLKRKILRTHKNFLSFNKNRTKKILAENKMIFSTALKTTPRVSKNELLFIGAALYWGEGSLREHYGRYPIIAFSNSSPEMVKVFMHYLRKILGAKDNQIRVGINIHPNIKAEKAKRFWSLITRLPKERFYTVEQISRASKFKRSIHFLPYGTLNIRVNNRKLFFKIKGNIAGITERLKLNKDF